MGSTNHAFDGGQSQGNTPYLLMICLLTGARGARAAADVPGPPTLSMLLYLREVAANQTNYMWV